MNELTYVTRLEQIIHGTYSEAEMPPMAPVVAMFLERYRPADPYTQPEYPNDNMTSYEIAELLEDTAAIPVSDIALVMTTLGYRLHRNEYKGYEWAMTEVTPRPQADNNTTRN